MNVKPFYFSKTFWANILMGLSMLLVAPEVQALLGEHALRIVAAAGAADNIALRLISSDKLSA